jgi:hypothetical protein
VQVSSTVPLVVVAVVHSELTMLALVSSIDNAHQHPPHSLVHRKSSNSTNMSFTSASSSLDLDLGIRVDECKT